MATQSNNSQNLVNQAIKIAEIGRDMIYIKDKLDAIEHQVTVSYVSKDEFDPVKRLVYGLVGLMLTGVIATAGAIIIK